MSGEQVAKAQGAFSNSLLKAHHLLLSPSDYHYVWGCDELLPEEPHVMLAKGSAKGKPVMIVSCASEADMLVMMMGRRLLSWLAPFIIRFALRGVGAAFLSPTAEAALAPNALKSAVGELTAGFDRLGSQSGGQSAASPAWLRLVNYVFGTGGIAQSRVVEALLAGGAGPIYAGLLELTSEESPKLGSGHGVDCFVLFRSDTPSHDRFLAEALCGKPTFPPSFVTLSSSMLRSWTTFAKTGSPATFGGVTWSPLPSSMRMRSSSPAVEQSEHAAGSEELALWKQVFSKYRLPLSRLG